MTNKRDQYRRLLESMFKFIDTYGNYNNDSHSMYFIYTGNDLMKYKERFEQIKKGK